MSEDDSKGKARPPYARYAFHNPYNYALMGGVGATALMTGNWWMLIAGAGMEALWMLFGPDSKALRKLVWDKQFSEEQRAAAAAKLQQMMGRLSDQRRYSFERLLATRDEIMRLSANNPSFTADLLRGELAKLDTLSDLYVELATTAERYDEYLERVDLRDLERESRRLEDAIEGPAGDVARKNLQILDRRKEKLREISDYVTKAQAQMSLIESTFQLLADQVVTLQSPHELGGQLDELIDGVEAVRDVSREAEKILQTDAA
jgi:hypothetical protein